MSQPRSPINGGTPASLRTFRRMSLFQDTAVARAAASPGSPRGTGKPDRAVTLWLWAIVAMVFAMVIVGGATRLTESGLSITQWRPIEGIVPPLSRADWLAAFARYRATPQFAQLFPDMSLSQFKGIFLWEWSHRLLGRVIGLVFGVPLVWFWLKGRISAALGRKLAVVFLLGGLQGAVGWWMVESGLTKRVEVAPERLATHLLLASVLLIVLVSMAVGSQPVAPEPNLPKRLRRTAAAIPFFVLAQIGLGALVAGSRAGWTYNTWPLMDGRFVPPLPHLTSMRPFVRNFFENVTTVQFDHRMMAYGLLAVVVAHALDARFSASGSAAMRRAAGLALLVAAQAMIGIMTLLLVVPVWAGLLHQAFAMIVLGFATLHWRRSRAQKEHTQEMSGREALFAAR